MIKTIIFIFTLSRPFPTSFGLKRSDYGIFWLFELFCYFFFNSLFGVRPEMIGTIIFIFTLSLPFPTWVCWERSHNDVFSFFEFFLEFSIKGRVGNDRNDNFHFHSFSVIPNLFWPEKMSYWCFLIF